MVNVFSLLFGDLFGTSQLMPKGKKTFTDSDYPASVFFFGALDFWWLDFCESIVIQLHLSRRFSEESQKNTRL